MPGRERHGPGVLRGWQGVSVTGEERGQRAPIMYNLAGHDENGGFYSVGGGSHCRLKSTGLTGADRASTEPLTEQENCH